MYVAVFKKINKKIHNEPVTKVKHHIQFSLVFTNTSSFPLSATKVAKHVLSILAIGVCKSTDYLPTSAVN